MVVNEYRTHSCGELRIENVGQEVKLAGWIDTIRKLGGITFVTLRDHFGLTQLVFNDENMLKDVCKETVIGVSGKVIERVSKNNKMPTGDIEVVVDSFKILGKCKNVLPFEISDAGDTKEDLRLSYRYLDLRNPENHDRIVKRSQIITFMRNKMIEMGFMEFQTPILTSSSPEGARDFLVPSRLNPGQFYALPQAPQQFKQLLMCSGFDNYFQVAPCFRDEDARADRTPGEFYQLDMEMSFATQEDVFNVIEKLVYETFTHFSNYKVSKPHFVRIPYEEAIDKYCSDKPDLRNPLIVKDYTEIFKNTQFNGFKNKVIKGIVACCKDKTRKFYDELTKLIISYEGKGLAYLKYENGILNGSITKFLTEQELNDIIIKSEIKDGETLFLIADEKAKVIMLTNVLRRELGKQLDLINKEEYYFCWIVDFPFFEWDEENNMIAFSHNPFSMPQGGMEALLNKDPLTIKAYQYDLVLNGYEMLSGAVRNHDPEIMVKAFEMTGYDRSVVENKFPALFNAFSYGAPPHAGSAIGLDRVIMLLTNQELIREVIAFPMNKNGRDLLMGAPSTVTEKQLREVHIKLRKED